MITQETVFDEVMKLALLPGVSTFGPKSGSFFSDDDYGRGFRRGRVIVLVAVDTEGNLRFKAKVMGQVYTGKSLELAKECLTI